MRRLLCAVLILCVSGIAVAAEKKSDIKRVEGFRKLKWQTSTTNAKSVYADLAFAWKSSGDNVIYKRTNEEMMIGETAFDEIRYTFKDDKFTGVIAIIELLSGTKMSEVADYERKNPTINFRKLKTMLEVKYGDPKKYEEKVGKKQYGITPLYRTMKKAEWLVGDSKVVLSMMTGSTLTLLKKNKRKNKKTDSLSLRIEHIKPSNLGF